MAPTLQNTEKGEIIQVFPLVQGKVNLTSGDVLTPGLIYCVADGNIVITWRDDSQSTISCSAGDCFSLQNCTKVTISTGTFHVA